MRELLQQALEKYLSKEMPAGTVIGDPVWWSSRIAKVIEAELAKPANEFHPDWDTLKPYHDRIAELEAQLAKPEYPDLRKAAEMALEALEKYEDEWLDDGRRIYVDAELDALRQALAQPEQEPVKKALRLKPHECICGYSVGHPLVPKCICKPEYTAQPEHPLAKKADNARELGLDYEPEHGFDRTASHMAGEYVDTAQYLHMNDRQRLEAIVDVVCRYLPPDGISIKQAMIEIIALVDPLPEQPEQEPMCWITPCGEGFRMRYEPPVNDVPMGWTPLYTAPQNPDVTLTDEGKTWQGLTDEEMMEPWPFETRIEFVRWIENKLREKNT